MDTMTSSCEPSSNNFPIYFQSIIPSISPLHKDNRILYATTGSLPSYIVFNRIWNFICHGTFVGQSVSVFYDATELIQKCPEFNVTFEGKINGQLTLGRCDSQLQKHVTYRVVTNESRQVTGIIFDITAPSLSNTDKIRDFYFNIFLNDNNNIVVAYGTPSSSFLYNWDGNGIMAFNTQYSPPDRFTVNNCQNNDTLTVTYQQGSFWIVYSDGPYCTEYLNDNICNGVTYTYTDCKFQ